MKKIHDKTCCLVQLWAQSSRNFKKYNTKY